jgi:hypothetical protein
MVAAGTYTQDRMKEGDGESGERRDEEVNGNVQQRGRRRQRQERAGAAARRWDGDGEDQGDRLHERQHGRRLVHVLQG